MAERIARSVESWEGTRGQGDLASRFTATAVEFGVIENDTSKLVLALQPEQSRQQVLVRVDRVGLVSLAKEVLRTLDPTVQQEILNVLGEIRDKIGRQGYQPR